MKAIISNYENKSARIKVKIPRNSILWKSEIEKISSSFFHKYQKQWSIPNTSANLAKLKAIFKDEYEIIDAKSGSRRERVNLSAEEENRLLEVEQKMILGGNSSSTIKAYKGELVWFFKFFENRNLEDLNKSDIETYVYKMKSKYKFSDSRQNTMINAIKFYYEKVLEKDRTYYNIERPKKSQSLPGVLTMSECFSIVNSPRNLKHKAILQLMYSSGLRISEVTKLRIEDVKSADKQLFIKASKGKKDRMTVLSENVLILLREYYKANKPSYWLFEGAGGEQYSTSSIQKVFRKAVKETNVNPWVTPHTLRHSFATHLLQSGVNLRYIQSLLGHGSSKTTEVYTHILKVNNDVVRSPLDSFMDNIKLPRQ